MSQQSNPETLREALTIQEALKWALNHVVVDEDMTAMAVIEWRKTYAAARAALAASGTEVAPLLTAEELKSCIFTFADGGLNFAVTLDRVNNLMRQKALRQPAQAAVSPQGEGREGTLEEAAKLLDTISRRLSESTPPEVVGALNAKQYAKAIRALKRQSAAPSGGAALITYELAEKIHQIIEHHSTDVVDYELAADDINALLAQESKTGAAPDISELNNADEQEMCRVCGNENCECTTPQVCPTCGYARKEWRGEAACNDKFHQLTTPRKTGAVTETK